MLSEAELDEACRRFGRAMRKRRLELDLPQRVVAERAGISVPYWSDLERGTKDPPMTTMRAVAGALELKLSELFFLADGR